MNDHSFIPTRTIAPERKRRAVLDAALDLFATRTYGATAMPDLAAAAGVAAGTIYRYFPSKEALANEVFREAKLALATRLLAGTPADASIRAEFDHYWQALVDFAREEPAAFAYLETHCHEPYLDDESRAVAAEVDAATADFVRRGQRAGAIRTGSPELLVALVFGAFIGAEKLAHDRGRPLTAAERRTARDAAWQLVARPTVEDSP